MEVLTVNNTILEEVSAYKEITLPRLNEIRTAHKTSCIFEVIGS